MKIHLTKFTTRAALLLVCMSLTSPNQALSQADSAPARKYSAPAVFGFTYGITSLGNQGWRSFVESYKLDIEEVKSTNYRKNGNMFDVFFKVPVHPQLTAGLQVQGIFNKMTIEYSDYSNMGFMQILFLKGERIVKWKTGSFLLLPEIAWYIPGKLDHFHPFLDVACGIGITNISMTDEQVVGSSDYSIIEGSGEGLVFSGCAGFETGGRILLFHLRAGYRYYNPSIRYGRCPDEYGLPKTNLSGFYANIGIGFRLQ